MFLRILAVILGLFAATMILWDGFDFALLPTTTRLRTRPSRLMARRLWWRGCRLAATVPSPARREELLSLLGPLSLVLNFVAWSGGLVIAFGMVQWGLESQLHEPGQAPTLVDYLYFSGVTFFTLGYGDIVPIGRSGRILSIVEVATGFSFLALMISYFPVVSQSYAAREVEVVKLAARAGRPFSAGELMLRAGPSDGFATLRRYFEEWEPWAATVYQSHVAYPNLAFFRSQLHGLSWLSAMTTMLDTAALMLTVVAAPDPRPAQTLFSMVRFFIVTLRQIYHLPRIESQVDRVPPRDLDRLLIRLRDSGFEVDMSEAAVTRFTNLRKTYEPGLVGLAQYFALELPSIYNEEAMVDEFRVNFA